MTRKEFVLYDKSMELDEKVQKAVTVALIPLLAEECKAGNIQNVLKLIAAGADVNLANGYYQTPLMFAAANGHDQLVQVLIDLNAALDVVEYAYYPISKHDTKAEYKNKNTGKTALGFAAELGYIEVVRALIKAGANTEKEGSSSTSENVTGKTGTPLFLAAENGHSEIVKMLIDAKANINFQKEDYYIANKYTSLMIALSKGHGETAIILINAGADVNLFSQIQGKDYTYIETALELAKSRLPDSGIVEMIEKRINKSQNLACQPVI